MSARNMQVQGLKIRACGGASGDPSGALSVWRNPTMKGTWSFGLITVLCFGLVGDVLTVQGADPVHFQAVGLVRFAKDIDLPDVSLPDVEGKDVPLRSFQGKVVLLNFWTT
jgi:hypothetical protein